MAIAFGAATSSSNTSSSSLTFAGPTVTGSDTILWVSQYLYRFTAAAAPTYNGVAMTLAGSQMSVESNRFLGLYYVVNPVSGANVVISGTGSDGTRGIRGVASYYTVAKQTGVPDATGSAGPNTTSPLTASTTTVLDNSWVVAVSAGPNNGGITASTGVTSRANPGGSGADTLNFGDSNGPKTPAGAYSTTFTHGGGDTVGQVTASFGPVATSFPDLRLAFL